MTDRHLDKIYHGLAFPLWMVLSYLAIGEVGQAVAIAMSVLHFLLWVITTFRNEVRA